VLGVVARRAAKGARARLLRLGPGGRAEEAAHFGERGAMPNLVQLHEEDLRALCPLMISTARSKIWLYSAVAASRRAPRPPSYAPPPFRFSAGGKLPVRRQQAAHPFRVGGNLGVHLSLWVELGSGKLHWWLKWPP